MRVQIVKRDKIAACGICGATDPWIRILDINGIIGLYCLKCDTLTLNEPIKTKYVYQAFKEECQKIKEKSMMKANNQLTTLNK